MKTETKNAVNGLRPHFIHIVNDLEFLSNMPKGDVAKLWLETMPKNIGTKFKSVIITGTKNK